MNVERDLSFLANAQKTRGWNNRSDQPCAVNVGACTLYIIPAWLWRPRPHARIAREPAELVRLKARKVATR